MITPIPYEKNIKKHPPEQLYKLALSIRDFGWRQPIVVDTQNVILAGHGRFAAYEKYKDDMKLELPWVEVADLPEEKARAYRLADNLLASTDYDMDLVFGEMDTLQLSFQELLKFDSTGSTEKKDSADDLKIDNPELYMRYLNNSIKQIILHYSNSDYLPLFEKIEKLKKDRDIENNSELFKYLIEQEHAKAD